MGKIVKYFITSFTIVILAACGGSSGSSSGGGGGGDIKTTARLSMGNISTIPTAYTTQSGTFSVDGQTYVVLNNNLGSRLSLVSATYTLYNSANTNPQNALNNPNSPADFSFCSSVQANGSCSISVKAPNGETDGQYLISAVFQDQSGTKYATKQIVSYSSHLGMNEKGMVFAVLNNTIYNHPGDTTSITIPFLTTVDLPKPLYAYSVNHNPAFKGTVTCPGNSGVGSICTLQVTISNLGDIDVLATQMQVSTEPQVGVTQGKFINLLKVSAVGYLFNVPVTVTQVTSGNLVTSGINVPIFPANGSSPKPVTLLNNGNAPITGISISVQPGSPVTIDSDHCTGTTLNTAVPSCTFEVNANTRVFGQSTVTVNYNTGNSSLPTKSITFNVIYLPTAAVPGISLTTSANVNPIPVNTTVSISVLVANTGNAAITGMNFTPSASLPAGFTYESNPNISSCSLSGQDLAVGASCTLVLKYAPTNSTPVSGALALYARGDFVNVGGGSTTFNNSLNINYSWINGNSYFVYISPSYVSFGIRSDNTESITQTFTLVNYGTNASNVESPVLESSITAFTKTADTCAPYPRSLAANGTCTYTYRFGPTSTTIPNVSTRLVQSYTTTGTDHANNYSVLNFNASPAALVNIESFAVQNATSNTYPNYEFLNSPANNTQIIFTITYKNNGTQTADNFSVALNNLPVGYGVVTGGTTCGASGGSVLHSSLAAGSSCNVQFTAIDPTHVYNPYGWGASLNFNLPGFSYTDTNTGLNESTPYYGNAQNISVNASSFVTSTNMTTTTCTRGGTCNLVFSGAMPNGTFIAIPVDQTTYPFIPTAQLQNFGLTNSTNKCTIASNTCTITTGTIPGTMATGVYSFNYIVTPSNSLVSGIIKTASFTLN